MNEPPSVEGGSAPADTGRRKAARGLFVLPLGEEKDVERREAGRALRPPERGRRGRGRRCRPARRRQRRERSGRPLGRQDRGVEARPRRAKGVFQRRRRSCHHGPQGSAPARALHPGHDSRPAGQRRLSGLRGHGGAAPPPKRGAVQGASAMAKRWGSATAVSCRSSPKRSRSRASSVGIAGTCQRTRRSARSRCGVMRTG